MAELTKEEEKEKRLLAHKYSKRLTVLKKAQELSQKDRIADAVGYYHQYLNIIAEFHGVKEEKIRPTHFQADKELAELLLISQVYWDLAKAYDRNTKLVAKCEHSLKQFTLFTAGFKYQYLNSEMIRKYIKKKIAYHPELFKKAHQDIKIQSKKCYIATYCFGEEHYQTETLRCFKPILLKSKIGNMFVDKYYQYSPRFLTFLDSYPTLGEFISKNVFKPILTVLAFFLRKFIL